MNKSLTHSILEFNYKVKEETEKLEEQTQCELAAMREQLVVEEYERKTNDQGLL